MDFNVKCKVRHSGDKNTKHGNKMLRESLSKVSEKKVSRSPPSAGRRPGEYPDAGVLGHHLAVNPGHRHECGRSGVA